MIHDLYKSPYMSDEQLSELLKIIAGDKAFSIHMPIGKNCPVDITYDGKSYVIHASGDVEEV